LGGHDREYVGWWWEGVMEVEVEMEGLCGREGCGSGMMSRCWVYIVRSYCLYLRYST
jgi:hypothetical protein